MVRRPTMTCVDVTPPEHLAILAQMEETHRECFNWLIARYGYEEALRNPHIEQMLQHIIDKRVMAECVLRRVAYRALVCDGD